MSLLRVLGGFASLTTLLSCRRHASTCVRRFRFSQVVAQPGVSLVNGVAFSPAACFHPCLPLSVFVVFTAAGSGGSYLANSSAFSSEARFHLCSWLLVLAGGCSTRGLPCQRRSCLANGILASLFSTFSFRGFCRCGSWGVLPR